MHNRWVLGGLALLVAILVGGGLALALGGGDDKKEVATGGTTTSTSTSTTTTTTVPVATTSTPVTVAIICTTAEDATKSIVNAWIAGDQAGASRCATPAVITKLFQTSGAGAQWMFQGCSGDPGVPTCSFSYEGGGANFTLNGTESGGWKAVDLSFVAD